MILVDGRLRGRKLGRRLMESVIGLAGGRECRLVATEDGLPLYEKLGFSCTGTVVQHQGIAEAIAPARDVKLMAAPDTAWMAELDRAATGMERGALLAAIAAKGEALALEDGFAPCATSGAARLRDQWLPGTKRRRGRCSLPQPSAARDDSCGSTCRRHETSAPSRKPWAS